MFWSQILRSRSCTRRRTFTTCCTSSSRTQWGPSSKARSRSTCPTSTSSSLKGITTSPSRSVTRYGKNWRSTKLRDVCGFQTLQLIMLRLVYIHFDNNRRGTALQGKQKVWISGCQLLPGSNVIFEPFLCLWRSGQKNLQWLSLAGIPACGQQYKTFLGVI